MATVGETVTELGNKLKALEGTLSKGLDAIDQAPQQIRQHEAVVAAREAIKKTLDEVKGGPGVQHEGSTGGGGQGGGE